MDICPNCKLLLGTPQGQVATRAPVIGDVSVCGGCASLLQYVYVMAEKRLRLRSWPRSEPIPSELYPFIEQALLKAQRDYLDKRTRNLAGASPKECAGEIIRRHRN